jgi:hypothetical protein
VQLTVRSPSVIMAFSGGQRHDHARKPLTTP